MSLSSYSLNHSLTALRGFAQPRPLAIAATVVASTAGLVQLYRLLAYCTDAYRQYIALGRGGAPYNLFGWLLQASGQLISPRAHKLRDPTAFANPALDPRYGPLARVSFLESDNGNTINDTTTAASTKKIAADPNSKTPLPLRAGQRPPVPDFVAPQRQTADFSSPELITRMNNYLLSVAAANPDLLHVAPSPLEGATADAAFVVPGACPAYLARIHGEAFHVHPTDGSAHVTLSLADAEESIRKGWAQRHKLSGVAGVLPFSYVMVYAPRDEDEYAVWVRIMRAGLAFVCGGREIRGA